MELLQRYLGGLVGVHVGDSLGAPYEKTYSKNAIARDIKERGGLTMFDYKNPWGTSADDRNGLQLPAGRPTDDSDQTADLCHSLISCNGLNPEHLKGSLACSVVHGISRLWSGQATGAGRTTKNALEVGAKTTKLHGVPMNKIGTNGSLMRCAPMGLWFGPKLYTDSLPNKEKARATVYKMSDVTHTNEHSRQSCWIYTLVLSGLLTGLNPADVWELLLDEDPALPIDPLFNRLLWSLQDEGLFPVDPGEWPARGTAEFSLYVALWSLLKSESFEHGIEMAVRVGGDTDTYAAIAGGLLGTHYGYEAIPENWRNTILGHDQMVTYADQLYQMRVS